MNHSQFRKSLAIAAIAFLSTYTASAATYTWNGSAGSSIWTNPNQWTPNAPGPVFTDDSSNPGDDLIFGASSQTTVNLRVDGGTGATNEDKVKSFTFTSSAPAYTFTSTSNTAGSAHDIDLFGNMVNNSGKTQTFATGIAFDGPITVNGTTGSSITNYSFEAGDHLWIGGSPTYNGPFDIHISGTSASALQGSSPMTITLNSAKIICEGGMTYTGDFRINGNGEIIVNGGGWGNGKLDKRGEGTLTLNAASNNSGQVVIDNGILRIGNNNALGSTSRETFISGNDFDGKLQLYNNIFVEEPITLRGRQTITGSSIAIENYSGTNMLAGEISITGGGGQYNFGAISGKLIIASALIVPSNLENPAAMRTMTQRGAGDLELRGGLGHDNSNGSIAVTHYGTGTLSLTGNNNYRVGHIMSVGGGTVKLDTSFGNAEAFPGSDPLFARVDDRSTPNPVQFQLLNNSKIDVVNAINLKVAGTSSFGLNRTLAGTGTMIGNVMTIAADANNTTNRYRNSDTNGKADFKPGNKVAYDSSGVEIAGTNAFYASVGKLTIQGNLDLNTSNSSDNLEWHLGVLKDQSNGTAGVDWDLLSVTGDTKIGTNDTFTLGTFTTIFGSSGPNVVSPNVFWNSSHSWKVLDTLTNSSGANNFLFAPGSVTSYNASGSFTGGYFTLSLGGGGDTGDVFLNWVTPIPEPSTILLVGASLVFCAYRIRRKA